MKRLMILAAMVFAALGLAGVATADTQNTIDFSSSQALAGNNNTPEARTAARVGGDEIAVNARLDGKHLFADTDIQDNASDASYTATIQKVNGPAEHILLNFLLPKSYVETTLNVEFPNDEVQATIFAWICRSRCTKRCSAGKLPCRR